MRYTITIKNQLVALKGLIYLTVFMLIAVFFLCQNDFDKKSVLVILGGMYSMQLTFVFFLHIEYYVKNKNDALFIDFNNDIIVVNDQSISLKEIEKIIFYVSPATYRGNSFKIMAFEEYYYTRMKMKDGREFIFTCLMLSRIEKVMELISGVVPIEKKKCLFPSISFG